MTEGDSATSIARCRRDIRELLKDAVESPARVADWLISSVAAVGSAELISRGDESLETSMLRRIARRARFVARGWPLQYVTRTMPFHGVQLTVDGRVLIPRPETEQLVERALELLCGKTSPVVMDVCSGSGSIALAIKMVRPDARVVGVELCDGALAASIENAARAGLMIEWIQADVLAGDPVAWLGRGGKRQVDVVVSNPPYIVIDEVDDVAHDVFRYEPHAALFAGATGLEYFDAIIRASADLLRPGGWLVFEGHEDRMDDVCSRMRSGGFFDVEMACDAAGRPRFAVGRFAEGR